MAAANLSLFKIFLKVMKFLPIIIAIMLFCNLSLLYFIGFYSILLCDLSSVSFLTLLFFYLTSYTCLFCFYHRLPIHFLLVVLILNLINYHFDLPSDILYWFYTIVFILTIGPALLKFKYTD